MSHCVAQYIPVGIQPSCYMKVQASVWRQETGIPANSQHQQPITKDVVLDKAVCLLHMTTYG